MPIVEKLRNDTSEAAIFARLWDSPEYGLTPALARHVLNLGLPNLDLERMH